MTREKSINLPESIPEQVEVSKQKEKLELDPEKLVGREKTLLSKFRGKAKQMAEVMILTTFLITTPELFSRIFGAGGVSEQTKVEQVEKNERYYQELAQDYPFIALGKVNKYINQSYAQKIIETAAEKSPWAALGYAENYINKPYAQKIIETAAEKSPWVALSYAKSYINKPYAQEIVEIAAEKDPEAALEHADRYINQPYAQKIIEIAAENNPRAALEYANNYKKLPEASAILQQAAETTAEKDPWAALEYAENYLNQPYAQKIIETAAEKDPGAALSRAENYINKPYAQKIIETAAEEKPWAALIHADRYINQPYAQKIIETAAQKDSKKALILAENYLNQPYAQKIIETAAEKDPGAALRYADYYISQSYARKVIEAATLLDPKEGFDRLDDYRVEALLKKSKNPAIKTLFKIKKKDYPGEIKYEIPILLHEIMVNKMSLDKAAEIVSYPSKFFTQLMEIKKQPNHLGEVAVDRELSRRSLITVHTINRLHNEPDEIRFKSMENASTQELYTFMVYGEEEIFTSSFNGLLNRLLERLKKENINGGQLLEKVGHNKFRTFVKLNAGFNRLNEFLRTMDSKTQKQLLDKFVKNVDKEKDKLSQAVVVADAFSMIENPEILKVLQNTIKIEYERVIKENNKEAIAIYGLLAGLFGEKAVINEAWIKEMSEKYKIPDLTEISSTKLFNRENTNIQQYFFYDDEDGRASFQNFLARYRNQSNWQIDEKENYLYLQSVGGDKKIEIYANKPAEGEEGMQEIEKILKEKNTHPNMIVHRGHSYHAGETIEKISSATQIVFLGSCGGYNNVSSILGRSSEAHILSTKGKGTMFINDPLLKMLNDEILTGKNIDWPNFWRRVEQKFGKSDDFKNYIPPHRNLGVLFLKAYNQLTK